MGINGQGKLFIITGTSAVGKTTIANLVLKKLKNFKRVITYTTRDIRPKEKNHRDYNFISVKNFKEKIKRKEFYEWAVNYGNYYGNSKKDVERQLKKGRNLIIVIDIKGALKIMKKNTQSASIFILPESLKQLELRFKQRHDTTPTDVKKRIKIARWELTKAPNCDYQIVNQQNKVDLAVKEVGAIIKSLTGSQK